MKLVRGIMVCLLLSIFARAQDESAPEHFQRFSVMPVVAYSEETELEYGGLLVLFFKPFEGSAHVSTIDLVALGTTRNQYGFRVSPDFWLLADQVHIPSIFRLYKWESSLFERGSRGNFDAIDTYERTFFKGYVPIELSFGIPDRLPFRYGPVLDGETRFHTEELDLRFYTPLFWRTSLALGAYFKQSKGSDIPVSYLAGSDGTKRFRGVDCGVWNDNQAMIFQMEFRRPLFWRLAGTIFGETFQSGPYFGEMLKRKMHYSVGFGGRLALNRTEKLHARGDISLIDGKHIGLTIDLREAF